MRNLAKYLLLAGVPLMFACSDKNEPVDPEEPDVVVDPVEEDNSVNLSEAGMANCYIVREPGIYRFKADNQFNLGDGLPVPPKMHPASAELVWETTAGCIGDVELTEKDAEAYVEFEVKNAVGNALIAVKNLAGNIEWSWHIWMPEEEVEGVATATGYEVMNMNLGALNNRPGDAGSYGMLYQWGRKDPFPAAATLTGDVNTVSAPMYDASGNEVRIENSDWTSVENNTLAYSIAHPTVCLSNYAQYSVSRDWLKASESDDTLWGNPEGYAKDDENNFINTGRKTCYDPSPAGWRVASPDVFRNFTTSGGYAWAFVDFNIADVNNDHELNLDDYNYGWHFNVTEHESLYFPAAARFDGSYAMLMGSMSGLWGNYWSNSPYEDMAGGGFAGLTFQVADMYGNETVTVSAAAGGSRADAYSVRCVKENPTPALP